MVFPSFKSLLLLCGLMLFWPLAEARNMYADYQKVTYSLYGGTMRLTCEQGFTQFRLTSAFGQRPRLYWKSGKRWVELRDVTYNDNSVVFEGMGKEGGVPVEELMDGITLPIFNQRVGISASEYFYKSQRPGFSEYVYIIDMINQQLTYRNINPIVDFLLFDKQRYRQDQGYRTAERIITVEQEVQQRIDRLQRAEQIEDIIRQNSKELRVVTPALHHEVVSTCYPH